jgi:hypothetical protein
MSSPNLKLTLTGRRFSLTPLPGHIQSPCSGEACSKMASHRLLSRATASVNLLCDQHALSWAGEHGYAVTTARRDDSAA